MAAGDGLVIMRPTSISYSGTSAGINGDGGIDFTAVTSLSLNGVFTGDYDNYLINCRLISASGAPAVDARMRAAGTDNSTANSYTVQYIAARNTTRSAERLTDSIGYYFGLSSTTASGFTTHIYGPYLAQPTVWRSVSADGFEGAYILDAAATHNQSTSYDGITLSVASSSVTGTVFVFGYEE